MGFLVSTVVITLFGEILPQAVCARHGLKIGGNLAWFVWTLEWVLYPVVKPIAVALNLLLGESFTQMVSSAISELLAAGFANAVLGKKFYVPGAVACAQGKTSAQFMTESS